jgi:hypothetical protein
MAGSVVRSKTAETTGRPASAISFDVFGARVELSGDCEDAIAAVRESLPGRRDAAGGEPDVRCSFERLDAGAVRLRGGGPWAPFTGTLEEACREALSRLHFEVAVAARSAVFLHAAAVVVADRLFLFPGRSGHGKSTMAAALVAAGGTYFSDEYAPVDPAGLVWPYRKPASLRPASAAVLSPVAAGGPEPAARRCDFVLGTRFASGAEWRPRRLSSGEAALLLIDNAVPARLRPQETAAAIARLLDARPLALEGERPEFERFVPEVLALAAAPATADRDEEGARVPPGAGALVRPQRDGG